MRENISAKSPRKTNLTPKYECVSNGSFNYAHSNVPGSANLSKCSRIKVPN